MDGFLQLVGTCPEQPNLYQEKYTYFFTVVKLTWHTQIMLNFQALSYFIFNLYLGQLKLQFW